MFKNLDPAILAAIIGGIFLLVAAFITGVLGLWQGGLSNAPDGKLPPQSRKIFIIIILLFIISTVITFGLFKLLEADQPLSPLDRAKIPVTSNADWTPYERDFDGVTMVLVPAGCFMMGSNDGDSDEQPVEQQCFDKPFWIDKYEVTNAQYGSVGCGNYSSDPNQPRNCVNWYNARDFCEARSARLPTEAEWEYAARGPDDLVYPWGNTFDAANVVAQGNQSANVGSIANGVSWVGAMDMSGNVGEWVNSLYQPYPYDGLAPVWWRVNKRHFQNKWAVSKSAGLRYPSDECNRCRL